MPNYLNEGGDLLRWQRFPILISIDLSSAAIVGDRLPAYEQGIRKGAEAWHLASGSGDFGSYSIELDASSWNVRVTFARGLDDDLFPSQGQFISDITDGRFLRRGTIVLYPEAISDESPDYIANLMAHEMGHALGLGKHSGEATDLMFQSRNFSLIQYPWVTERDLNTLLEAYCQ